jgi:hypothetical protein
MEERIEKNTQYVSQFTIQLLSKLAYSKENLFAIRLLINKADLLERLINSGRITSDKSVHDYAISAYKTSVILDIDNYCKDVKIDIKDFSIWVVSGSKRIAYLKNGKTTGINEIFEELLEKYEKRSA